MVNSRPDDTEGNLNERQAGVNGIKIVQPGVLYGPHLRIKKGTLGTVATMTLEEGMWEHMATMSIRPMDKCS